MDRFKLAVSAVLLAGLGAPAAAQVGGFDGIKFADAVRKRDGETAMQLLGSRGAAIVNARDGRGETALVIAVAARDETWTSFLLHHGADPNLASRSGDTPLMAAARIGFESAARRLIARKAKVDVANRMGETALILAVQQRQPELVRMLLAAGANPDVTDNAAGLSARDYAKRDTRSRDILKLIESAKTPASAAKP